MRKMVFSLLLISTAAFADASAPTCGPETVEWPPSAPANDRCGDQIWANSPVALGTLHIVMDPVYSGSDALFRCTEKGWVFVSGTCTATGEPVYAD